MRHPIKHRRRPPIAFYAMLTAFAFAAVVLAIVRLPGDIKHTRQVDAYYREIGCAPDAAPNCDDPALLPYSYFDYCARHGLTPYP